VALITNHESRETNHNMSSEALRPS